MPFQLLRPAVRRLSAAAFMLPLAACASVPGVTAVMSRSAPPDGVPRGAARGAVTDHVVVISIDGLRPDAIAAYRTPTLRRLLGEGSYTLDARTILPSKTLPSHTSMLTGAEPAAHGITWNSDRTSAHGHLATPTVFALARARGFHTAAFFSKSKFHHLEMAGTLDHAQSPRGSNGKLPAATTTDSVAAYLARERPNLLFVHIGEPDHAGHLWGWMSGRYGRAVQKADGAVAEVLRAADGAFGSGGYTVILTADHGGHGRNHGSADPRDVTIPWVAWGEGVRKGTVLPAGVRTTDTAATALWLLGVARPATVTGDPVIGAFGAAAAEAAEAAEAAAMSGASAP
jgi:predicted AlkP superfamily pyrophosphatase or phosphodiesterase